MSLWQTHPIQPAWAWRRRRRPANGKSSSSWQTSCLFFSSSSSPLPHSPTPPSLSFSRLFASPSLDMADVLAKSLLLLQPSLCLSLSLSCTREIFCDLVKVSPLGCVELILALFSGADCVPGPIVLVHIPYDNPQMKLVVLPGCVPRTFHSKRKKGFAWTDAKTFSPSLFPIHCCVEKVAAALRGLYCEQSFCCSKFPFVAALLTDKRKKIKERRKASPPSFFLLLLKMCVCVCGEGRGGGWAKNLIPQFVS